MISREAYRGPLTKSALAMFERADRRNGVASAAPPRSREPCAKGERRSRSDHPLAKLGVSRGRLRQWEDYGLITLRRGSGGHRIIDERVVEHVRTICALRRLGLGLREISWLSQEGPPTLETLKRELQALSARAAAQQGRSPVEVFAARGDDTRTYDAGAYNSGACASGAGDGRLDAAA